MLMIIQLWYVHDDMLSCVFVCVCVCKNITVLQSTTSAGGGCRTSFGGTSSAAPMAAGIIALTLEAKWVTYCQ